MKKTTLLILFAIIFTTSSFSQKGPGIPVDTIYTNLNYDQYHCPSVDTTRMTNPNLMFGEVFRWYWDTNLYPNVSFSNVSDPQSYVYNLPHDTCFVCYWRRGLGGLSGEYYALRICNNKANAGLLDLNWCTPDSTDQQQLYAINADTTSWWSIADGMGTFEYDTLYNTHITDYRANAYKNYYVWNIIGCTGDTLRDTVKAEVTYLRRQYITPIDTPKVCSNSITTVISPYPGYLESRKLTYSLNNCNPLNDTSYVLCIDNESLGAVEAQIHYKGCVSHADTAYAINTIPNKKLDFYYSDGANEEPIKNFTFCDEEIPIRIIENVNNSSDGLFDAHNGYWTTIQGSINGLDSLYTYSGSMQNYVFDTISGLMPDTNIFVYTQMGNIDSTCLWHDTLTVISHRPSEANIINNDTTICLNSFLIQADSLTHGTGIWGYVNGSGVFDSINNPIANISDMSYGINTVYWQTQYYECDLYDTITVINDLPTTPNAGYNVVLCEDYASLNANTIIIGDGNWFTIQGNVNYVDSINPNTQIFNIAPDTNILVWHAVHNTCGLSDTLVLVNNKPTLPIIATNDTILCSNEFLLSANTPTQGNGQWSFVNGSGFMADIHNPTTQTEGLQQGINTIRWTITKQNCELYDEIVIVNSLPSNAFAGYNQTLCKDTFILEATQPAIGTGFWSIISGGATFADTTNPNSIIWNINNGENKFSFTTVKGNCVLSDTVIITNNTPTKAIINTQDTSLCANTYLLKANTPVIGEGVWSTSNNEISLTHSDSIITNVSNLSQGENTFVWTINNNGCSSSDKVIIINNLPDNPNAGGIITVCGNTKTLNANNPVIGTGLWSSLNNDINFSSITNPEATISNLPKGKSKIIWTTTNANCVLTDTALVYSSQMTIQTDTVNVSGFNKDDGQITVIVNNGIEPYTYEWKDNDGLLNYISENLKNLPANTYIVTATDSIGCTVESKVVLTDDSYLKIYNTFTPNGDGINDTWEIDNISFYKNAIVKVFNQWGNVIFESTGDYNPWDGTYKGKILPTGSYYYIIDVQDNVTKPFTGAVLILN